MNFLRYLGSIEPYVMRSTLKPDISSSSRFNLAISRRLMFSLASIIMSISLFSTKSPECSDPNSDAFLIPFFNNLFLIDLFNFVESGLCIVTTYRLNGYAIISNKYFTISSNMLPKVLLIVVDQILLRSMFIYPGS